MLETTITEQKFSIVKLIPITILITVLSQISVLSFYSFFGFSPLSYLEPYEILTSSVKDFIIIGIIVVILFQFVMLFVASFYRRLTYYNIRRFRKKNTYSQRTNRRDEVNSGFKTIRNIRRGIDAFIIIFMIFIIVSSLTNLINLPHFIPFLIMYTIVLLLMRNYIDFKVLTLKSKSGMTLIKQYFPHVDIVIALAVGILVIFMIELGHVKAKYIKENNIYAGSSLTLDDNELIRVTTKVILIGKFQKFYFFYNTPDSTIRVIDRSKIKKEIIKASSTKSNFYVRF
ncbi:hypothetical protein WAE58_21675 [Pedobacter panaciterrae]|uniref:RDD family protein n=1 Tax=Pedobacter panaciterrae TaxID=363849 RepID=A0ABU8NS37_9SPHI